MVAGEHHGSLSMSLPGQRMRRLSLERLEERRLLSGVVLKVEGDQDPAAPDDAIAIEPAPDDPALIQASVNGRVVATVEGDQVRAIKVKTGKGDDVVEINLPDTVAILAKVRVSPDADGKTALEVPVMGMVR